MIEYNSPYYFHISDVAFGTLSTKILCDLFKDGRVVSHFLEMQLEVWFPNLLFEDGRGYDHRCLETDVLYDAKCFTKRGTNFCPSVMIGAGRKVNEEELHNHATSMNYIICDVYDFPKVRVIFKRGEELLNDYPKGKIPFKDREKIFTPVTQLDRVSDF
jgi:hypothetical protein